MTPLGFSSVENRLKLGMMAVLIGIQGCVTNPMTGKRSLIATSEAEENQMGEQAYREILSKEQPTRNTTLARQVQTVGERIARVSAKPDLPWEFQTIESKTPNAFALPGGKVAFYTGILTICQTEAGLATVMGHEIAHVIARHGGQRISQQLGLNLGLGLLSSTILDNPRHQSLVSAALGIGVMLPFSRAHETEADEMGIILMARAGFDPRQAPQFWDRFAQVSGGDIEFLSTHPNSSGRRDRLQELLPEAILEYEKAPQKMGVGAKLAY